jgi:hypothetical protein
VVDVKTKLRIKVVGVMLINKRVIIV